MDRLGALVTQLKPYLKCVFDCIILHMVVCAPYGSEKHCDNDAIFTMGMQDISLTCPGFFNGRFIIDMISKLQQTKLVLVFSGTLVSDLIFDTGMFK